VNAVQKLAKELGITEAELRARIATPSPTSSVAAAHWKARDVACPRGCGRTNFRTIGGATGTHRNPAGGACKA
jgi:hypothetical protein